METRQPLTEIQWQIEQFDQVGSTMDVAAQYALADAPAGIVVVADEQTAGRGRHGRPWIAPAGSCLLFTALLRPSMGVVRNPKLSLRIAECVSRAVERSTGLKPELKEPNDVLVNGRKLAGILCQTSVRGDVLDYLLVGIGLNVNVPEDQLPFDTATSLLVETGQTWSRDLLLDRILAEFERTRGLTRVY